MTDQGNEQSGAAGAPIWVPDGPAVVIGPVGDEARPPRGRIATRIAAVALALGLAGGGVALAVNAGSATGGADSPEAAVEQLLESLSNEDILGAAEVIEPSERDTLVDAGVSIADELVRLEVFSGDLDLGALSGVDFDFADLRLRSIPVLPNVAQVFIDGGVSTASIDVSEFPLGKLILDRAPDDWLTFTETVSSPIDSTVPIAAVERDGRWYVSLWYSVAENARLDANQPPPSIADRPVAIGADTPEAAVERLIREAARLDPRTVIGMLDPEEMAALYDYSPLFLDEAESAANEALRAAADAGVTWSIDSIVLSSETSGDLATVKLEAFEASLDGPDIKGSLSFSKERLAVTWTTPDYMGNLRTTSIEAADGCMKFESDDPDMGPAIDSCDPDAGPGFFGFGPLGALPSFGADSGATYSDVGIVTREVDGRWFVSPIRTVTTAVLSGLRSIEPADLATTVDSVMGMFSDPFGVDTGFGTFDDQGFPGPSTTFLPPVPTSPDLPGMTGEIPAPPAVGPMMPIGEFELDNADLLPEDLMVLWALDLPIEELPAEIGHLAPDLGPVGAVRGAMAFVPDPRPAADRDLTITVAVTAIDLTDESRAVVAAFLGQGASASEVEGEFGDTNLLMLDGNRLLVVGGFDLAPEFLREFADTLR